MPGSLLGFVALAMLPDLSTRKTCLMKIHHYFSLHGKGDRRQGSFLVAGGEWERVKPARDQTVCVSGFKESVRCRVAFLTL